MRAEPGEVLAVLGPNGAGKTSTFETLEGYRRPADGRVRVLGLDPVAQHRALVARIGVMLQRGGVYPMLGPAAGPAPLRLLLPATPRPRRPLGAARPRRRCAETPWRHLSGGEQQRLSLALALVGRPDVALSSTSRPPASTPRAAPCMRAVIAGLAERGTCVLLATHELAEAERLADRVVIVQRGARRRRGQRSRSWSPRPGVLRFVAPPGLDTDGLGAALGAPVSRAGAGRYRVDGGRDAAAHRGARGVARRARRAALGPAHGHSLEELYLADGRRGTGRHGHRRVGRASAAGGGRDEGARRPDPRRAAMTLRRGETLLLTLGIPVGFLVFFSTVHVVDTRRVQGRGLRTSRGSSPSR